MGGILSTTHTHKGKKRQSSGSNVLLIGAGVTVAGLLAYLGYSYMAAAEPKKLKAKVKKSKKSQKKAQEETKSEAAPVAAPKTSTATPAAGFPSPQVMVQVLQQCMTDIQKNGTLDGPAQRLALSWIRATKPGNVPAALEPRVGLCQWGLMYYMFIGQARLQRNLKPSAAEEKQYAADMEALWLLVDEKDFSAEQVRQIDPLRIEIAQKLEDADRMLTLFNRMSTRADRSFEEAALCFTIAPMVGRLSMVKSLSEPLTATEPKMLESFHQASLQRPDMPDFAVLFEKCTAEGVEDVPKESLKWEDKVVTNIDLTLKSIEGDDEKQKEALIGDYGFKAEGDDETKVAHMKPPKGHEAGVKLMRHGSAHFMKSFTGAPAMISGIARDDETLDITGYFDVAQRRQSETYNAKLVDGKWKGTYTMEQVDTSATPHSPLIKLVCELEMHIQ